MVYTNKFLTALLISIVSNNAVSNTFTGLATHDQNPLLIPYWIPHTIAPQGKEDIQFSSSLFVTNTLHNESNNNELLIIDAETYRLNLNFQYEVNEWTYALQVPLVSTRGGFLDEFIIDWHDFFSLPQGQRLSHSNDQVHIQYQVNNIDLINSQNSYDGIADISLSILRSIFKTKDHNLVIGTGINLPSGENNLLISNDKIDYSIWLSYFSQEMPFFATLGLIHHGKEGVLKDKLNSLNTFAQTGVEFSLSDNYSIQLQLDYHSNFTQSETTSLGESLQMQFGLHVKQIKQANVYLFFSEDILVNSAPDITFATKINWSFE